MELMLQVSPFCVFPWVPRIFQQVVSNQLHDESIILFSSTDRDAVYSMDDTNNDVSSSDFNIDAAPSCLFSTIADIMVRGLTIYYVR